MAGTELTLIDFEGSSLPTSTVSANVPKFEETFWGQECRGFEVLNNNLKATTSAAQHLGEYIKERVSLEKNYVKGLQKLAKSYNQVADSSIGSFYPVWLVVLKTLDTACINKERHIERLKELGKEIDDYARKRDERMKSNIKGEIETAQKSLTQFLQTVVVVRKRRKQYKTWCTDLAEQQRELEKVRSDQVSKAKDIDKHETKVKKSTTHVEGAKGEYQKAIQKHHDQWKEFEQKMTTACKKFQQLEEEHISQMRLFVMQLADIHNNHHVTLFRDFKKLKEKMETLPVEKILSMFTQLKGTGKNKPELLQFIPIAVDAIKLSQSGSLSSISSETKKGKKLKGKKKKQQETQERPPSTISDVSAATPNVTEENGPEVDEEGFTIRPKDAEKISSQFWDQDLDRDSSDFESDDEPEKKIRDIKIKDTTTADVSSIDELSSAVKMLKLEAPAGGMKRAGSTQSLNSPLNTPQLKRPSPAGSQSLLNESAVPKTTSFPNMQEPLPLPSSNSGQLTTSTSGQGLSSNNSSTIAFPTNWDDIPFDASLPPLPPSSLQTSSMTNSWTTFTPEKSTESTVSISDSMIPNPTTMDLINKTQELITKTQISLNDSVIQPQGQPDSLDLGFSSLDKGVRSLLPPPSSLTPTSERKRGVVDSLQVGVSRGTASQPGSPMGKRHPSVDTASLSPLTTKTITIVPIAIAFQETCNAIFKGSDLSKAVVKVTGCVEFSFHTSYITALTEPLAFSITQSSLLTKVLHNQNFLTIENENVFVFQMDKVKEHLVQSKEKSSSPFHNITAIKYEVMLSDASKLPLILTCFWKSSSDSYTMRMDYTYNPLVFPLSPAPSLQNTSICLPIKGNITDTSSDPPGSWVPNKQHMIWNLEDIDGSEEPGTRTIKCKFSTTSGSSFSPAPAAVKFICDGSTLSGATLSLNTKHYKISLRKNKCASGTYMIENLAGISS